MLLKNKNAVIYGAGGSIGGAVARAFASEGAKVFLSGRTMESLKKVAEDITASGGQSETEIVDALDEKSVNDYVDTVGKKAERIDISFNAIGIEDTQGSPLADMSLEDFICPIKLAMQTQFLTAKAVSKIMMKQGAGVIMSITASPAGKAYSLVGGFGPACSALEGFSRNLAAELGPHGIRVVCIRSAGSPDSKVFVDAVKKEGSLAKTAIQDLVDDTMLRKLPLMEEIANVAPFMVSDQASAMTGTTVNVTCSTTRD
jgi:NAD(P)-dependent dehydrogenase (short-subunit alcohol dehydrogenase family)